MDLGRALCRVGLHRWKAVRERGVPPYTACARCRKEQMLDLRPERFMGGTEGGLMSGRDRP